jgi:hypothetical protein
MPENYKRLLKNDHSLTLVTGTRNLISSLLMLEMMHEHLNGDENVRTVYVDPNSNYFESKARVLRALKEKNSIFIFDNIIDTKFSRLFLLLMNCEATVWVGVEAPNANLAKLILKAYLEVTTESSILTESSCWIIDTYIKLVESMTEWNTIDLCEFNKTFQQIHSSEFGFELDSVRLKSTVPSKYIAEEFN